MRSINVRQFRANYTLEIKDLPLEVTKNGKPLFYVLATLPDVRRTASLQASPTVVAAKEPKPKVKEGFSITRKKDILWD